MAKTKNPFLITIAEFIRGADFPVIGISHDGKIIDLNQEAERILGLKKKSLINSFIFSLLSLSSQKIFEKILTQSTKLKKFRLHVEFVTNEVILNATLFFLPLYKNDKEPAYFLLSFNNPQKAARLQIEIEAANRIADLNMKRLHTSNLKLQEARKAEQTAIKAKEHFFASISHEIRTPLNGILGITKLLADTALNIKQREFINAVINSSEQLLNIINDLLDLSKINSFNFKLENEKFNLQQSLFTIVPVFTILAENKNLTFDVNIDQKIPKFIIGDKYRLNQVINNLLNNAFKFTTNGGVSFKVRVLEMKNDTVLLEFNVCDTGIGIEKEDLEKVFETFTPVTANTSKQYGGTGLGLSISKHLVELMGGTITVSSIVGKGTCFTFQIPYSISDNQDSDIQEAVIKRNAFSPIKILAVDDNEVNRFYITHLFDDENIQIKTAENGEECINILKKEGFDIILMDLQMPVLDGYKTTEYIRKELKLTTPVVALTAASLQKEEKKCLRAGMNKVLQKPFSKETLEKAINEFILKDSIKTVSLKTVQNPGNLNLEYIYSIAGTDKHKINELVNISLKNIETENNNIHQAINEKDLNKIKALAHKLKSTFGLYGVNELHEGLNEIEKLCSTSSNLKQIKKNYNQMKDAIEKVKIELKNIQSN